MKTSKKINLKNVSEIFSDTQLKQVIGGRKSDCEGVYCMCVSGKTCELWGSGGGYVPSCGYCCWEDGDYVVEYLLIGC